MFSACLTVRSERPPEDVTKKDKGATMSERKPKAETKAGTREPAPRREIVVGAPESAARTWRRASRCCAKHRNVKPDADLGAKADEDSLRITVSATHPCGIKWIRGKLVIMEPGESIEDGWEKDLDATFSCNPSVPDVTVRWTWGANEDHALPIKDMTDCRIHIVLTVWSCCDDFETLKKDLKV